MSRPFGLCSSSSFGEDKASTDAGLGWQIKEHRTKSNKAVHIDILRTYHPQYDNSAIVEQIYSKCIK